MCIFICLYSKQPGLIGKIFSKDQLLVVGGSYCVPAPAAGVVPVVGVPVAVGVGVVPPGAQGLGRGCVFSCPCCWPPEVGIELPAVNQVTTVVMII